MRVPRPLQNRSHTPSELAYGYVFLANDAAQEGLLAAGELINAMKTQRAELGSQTVVTYIGGEKKVQVVKEGQPLSLFVEDSGNGPVWIAEDVGAKDDPAFSAFTRLGLNLPLVVDTGNGGELCAASHPELETSTPSDGDLDVDSSTTSKASEDKQQGMLLPVLIADSKTVFEYGKREDSPKQLITERLPDLVDSFEEQLIAQIQFSSDDLLASQRRRVRVRKRIQDVFAGDEGKIEDSETWTQLEPGRVAALAEQTLLKFEDIDPARFPNLLLERF